MHPVPPTAERLPQCAPGAVDCQADGCASPELAASLLAVLSATTPAEHVAARDLAKLSMDVTQRESIVAAGGVGAMMRLLDSNVDHLCLMAVGTIANLAASVECHAAIFDAGGIERMAALARHHDERTQTAALGALCNLARSQSHVPAILAALEAEPVAEPDPQVDATAPQWPQSAHSPRNGLRALIDPACSPLRSPPSFRSPVHRFNPTTGLATPVTEEAAVASRPFSLSDADAQVPGAEAMPEAAPEAGDVCAQLTEQLPLATTASPWSQSHALVPTGGQQTGGRTGARGDSGALARPGGPAGTRGLLSWLLSTALRPLLGLRALRVLHAPGLPTQEHRIAAATGSQLVCGVLIKKAQRFPWKCAAVRAAAAPGGGTLVGCLRARPSPCLAAGAVAMSCFIARAARCATMPRLRTPRHKST